MIRVKFQDLIIDWYSKNGRHFFWRDECLDGWKWLALEVLLRKTRAETVEKYYKVFIDKYNSPLTIFEAKIDCLKNDLKCFGLYQQRSEAFKIITNTIINKYGGSTDKFLSSGSAGDVKHLGAYTLNAVSCFCYGQRCPIVDVNTARIITRYHRLNMPRDLRENWIWVLAEQLLPVESYVEYNYGLLDIGALYCKKTMKCEKCPLNIECFMACGQ